MQEGLRDSTTNEADMQVTQGDGSLLERIASKLPYLPQALKQVAEYILENPEEMQAMSITTLAESAKVAESTVSRFAREMGVSGYQSLRLGIAESTFANRSRAATSEKFVYEGISRDDDLGQIVRKIHRSSEHALERTASHLSVEAIESAVDIIERSSTLVFTCMGSSSIAAEEGVMRFTRAGKKCILYRDQSIQAMLATILSEGDAVLAISDSGHSTSIVEVVRQARAHGAATIVITSHADSPLAQAGDVALYTATVPSGGELYGEAVTAKWSQLLTIDVLYAAYAARNSDLALAHLKETFAAGIQHSRS